MITIVKMLKAKFPTLTPQDPKCQILSHMSLRIRKPTVWVSYQVQHKQVCTVMAETG